MHKVLGVLVALFSMLLFLAMPVTARANTVSSEQEVIIHAVVASTRYIIVNDKGQMTTIFSNSDENVTPEVHLDSPAGPLQELTPELHEQYEQEIKKHDNLAGIKISVPLISTIAHIETTPESPALKTARTQTFTKFIAQLSPPFFIKS